MRPRHSVLSPAFSPAFLPSFSPQQGLQSAGHSGQQPGSQLGSQQQQQQQRSVIAPGLTKHCCCEAQPNPNSEVTPAIVEAIIVRRIIANLLVEKG
jgi:hypothetical protein